jgi:hypothetical protein
MKHVFVILSVFCSLIFIGCVTYSIEETGTINHSFPITNGIIEQGHIGIIKEDILSFTKQEMPNTEIIVIGRLNERKPEQVAWVEYKSKNKDENDTVVTGFKRENQWAGSIIMENKTSEFQFSFDEYSPTKDGEYDTFAFREDKSGDRIEFNHILNGYEISAIPYQLGTFFIADNKYSLYMVLEPEYTINSSTTPVEEILQDDPNILQRRKLLNIFAFKQDQIFQILNGENQTIAQLKGDIYTLYDPIQQTDLVPVKKLIAQFYTFIRLILQHHMRTDTRGEPLLVNKWRPN